MHLPRLPEHRDRNFAQSFSVLDRLFASYYAPGYDEVPRPVRMARVLNFALDRYATAVSDLAGNRGKVLW